MNKDSFHWDREENRCFGCGDNPCGLKLKFRKDGDWVQAKAILDWYYQGFQDVTHGGIVATMLDEAASWAIMIETGHVAPSFEISCRFNQPVPLGEEITVKGRVLSVRHGIAHSEAQVLNSRGKVLASGKIGSRILS